MAKYGILYIFRACFDLMFSKIILNWSSQLSYILKWRLIIDFISKYTPCKKIILGVKQINPAYNVLIPCILYTLLSVNLDVSEENL